MTVCILAAWRGRDDERMAAGAELATWALSMVAARAHADETPWTIMAIDVGLFAIFFWIALRSARFWPLFAAGFHLLALGTHLAHSLDTQISRWAYITAGLIWNYLTLFAIGYGALTAPKRYAEIEALEPKDVPGATRR